MNRRGFLSMLAGAVLDPERLLWVPGKKLISIPKPVAKITGLIFNRNAFALESEPLDLSDWEVVDDGAVIYTSARVEAIDRLWVMNNLLGLVTTQEMSREEFQRRYP